jgi:hypothetical protein
MTNQHPRKAIVNPNITKEMVETIETFKCKFKLKYGITPYVSINTRGNYMGQLSLKELFDIVNEALANKVGHKYKEGILTATRLREVVLYRQAFCKIGMHLGYKVTSIAEFINKNHATVIHSVRNIDNLLSVDDIDVTTCMNELYTLIETYISMKEYEEVLQQAG